MARSAMVQVLAARVGWLEALAFGDEVFTKRFGIPVVAGWVGFPEALPAAVNGARGQSEDPWGTYLFFDDDDGALVGFGGFKGEPRNGEVELGYAVAPRAKVAASRRPWSSNWLHALAPPACTS